MSEVFEPLSPAVKKESIPIDRVLLGSAGDLALRLLGSEGKVGKKRRSALQNIVQGPSPFIVQIGANDGKFDDPLHDFLLQNEHVSALLVEPLQQPFELLRKLHAGRSNIQLVNAAIGNEDEIELWKAHFKNRENDPFGGAIARTDKDSIERILWRHPIRRLGGYTLESETVRGISMQDLLTQQSIDPLNITAFFCDTEGADVGITGQLLDSGAKPDLIQYEHILSTPHEIQATNARLHLLGYGLTASYRDILALQAP